MEVDVVKVAAVESAILVRRSEVIAKVGRGSVDQGPINNGMHIVVLAHVEGNVPFVTASSWPAPRCIARTISRVISSYNRFLATVVGSSSRHNATMTQQSTFTHAYFAHRSRHWHTILKSILAQHPWTAFGNKACALHLLAKQTTTLCVGRTPLSIQRDVETTINLSSPT